MKIQNAILHRFIHNVAKHPKYTLTRMLARFAVVRKTVASQFSYVPLLGLAMAMMMLRLLVMARLLEAEQFAVYSAGLLISSTFCMLGCIGLQPLLQRSMPANFVKGKTLSSITLLIQSLYVAFACAAFGVLLAASGITLAGLTGTSLGLSIFHGLSQQMFLLSTVESRSRLRHIQFGRQNFVRAVTILFCGWGVALGTHSAKLILLCEALISIVLSIRFIRIFVKETSYKRFSLALLALRSLKCIPWRTAFNLSAMMVVTFLSANADRWIAASSLDSSLFAQYAFAWMLVAGAESFQVLVNSSVYPTLSRRNATNGASSSFEYASRIALFFLAIGAIAILPSIWTIKQLVQLWFPEFSVAASLIPIFMIIVVLKVSDFWTSHLVIIGKERFVLAAGVLSVLIALCIVSVAFSFNGGMPSINQVATLALLLASTNYIFVCGGALCFRR